MQEVEINGRTFHIKKLGARQQFHLARRLAPIIAAFVAGASADDAAKGLAGIDLSKIGEELAGLSDANADYIMDTCLAAVTYRDDENKRDYPIQVRPGVMRYDWIELPEMLRLCVAVIQDNLGGFMAAAPSGLTEKDAA